MLSYCRSRSSVSLEAIMSLLNILIWFISHTNLIHTLQDVQTQNLFALVKDLSIILSGLQQFRLAAFSASVQRDVSCARLPSGLSHLVLPVQAIYTFKKYQVLKCWDEITKTFTRKFVQPILVRKPKTTLLLQVFWHWHYQINRIWIWSQNLTRGHCLLKSETVVFTVLNLQNLLPCSIMDPISQSDTNQTEACRFLPFLQKSMNWGPKWNWSSRFCSRSDTLKFFIKSWCWVRGSTELEKQAFLFFNPTSQEGWN